MLLDIALHQPHVLLSIVRRTPLWVWGLLVSLLWLGLGQMLPRRAGLRRVLWMPVAMALFSAYGLAWAFSGSHGVGAVAAWLLAALAMATASLLWRPQPPASTHYDTAEGRFHLPGSGVPLGLILGIFFTKYVVGVELALQPPLAHDSTFTLQVATLYGVFNGLLAARAARLWQLARQASAPC